MGLHAAAWLTTPARGAAQRRRREEEEARRATSERYKERMRKVSELNKKGLPAMPFTRVYSVFNHANLWVNVQRGVGDRVLLHPAELSYDFGGSMGEDDHGEEDGSWIPLWNAHTSRGKQPTCFFDMRGLGPPLSEDRVEDVQAELTLELEEGLVNVRASKELATSLAPKLSKKIQDVLSAMHAVRARAGAQSPRRR